MNQLSGIPGKFIAYGYDALGRRERKTIGEDVYTYVWVGKQMVEEHGPDGVRKFVYGDGVDEPVCRVEPDGGICYFHRGISKSVIALSDESGAVVETYAYTPFGKPSVNETGGTPKSPFLFAGRWYEADAGMYYYRARHYHPELRTFLQPDPLGYEDGLNWYVYVHNNPVTYYDPMGTEATVLVGGEQVLIFIGIRYQGAGTNAATIQKFNQGIESHWSGQFGKYNVTTTVYSGDQNVITVPNHSGRSHVVNSNQGVWYNDSSGWVAAHEAGHLLGLPDRYTDISGPRSGWEGNIMAQYGGDVWEISITDAINNVNNSPSNLHSQSNRTCSR